MLRLQVELRKNKITQKKLADLLNLSQNSTSQKLRGVRQFNACEMFLIQDKLFPQIEIKELFSMI